MAGAYWRGDSSREQLTRIYGTAFFDKKELDKHLQALEEAKQRDHRVIGQKLGLFAIDEQVGPGLILWKPKGAMVRLLLQQFLQDELFRRGYQMVFTPHIGRLELYRTSGHFPYYRESQFQPLFQSDTSRLLDRLWEAVSKRPDDHDMTEEEGRLLEELKLVDPNGLRAARPAKAGAGQGAGAAPAGGGGDAKKLSGTKGSKAHDQQLLRDRLALYDDYLLKPMNCPHHIKIYASEPRSYRDLPLRLAEFGTVYRFEQTGELNGMTRVRGFTQDDAHIFCTHEQVKGEFRSTVELVQFVFNTLGFKDVQIRLSKSDPNSDKFAGNREFWLQAEQEIREVLTEMKADFVEAEGEAAFYGPKVDFLVRDVIGRKWQLGTVQLDYVLPERFKIEYAGSDNHPHRPVMIHRAPFGSMERFMGILIEHFGGAFPLWLAPDAGGRPDHQREAQRLRPGGRIGPEGRRHPGGVATGGGENWAENPGYRLAKNPLRAHHWGSGSAKPHRGRPPQPHEPGSGANAADRVRAALSAGGPYARQCRSRRQAVLNAAATAVRCRAVAYRSQTDRDLTTAQHRALRAGGWV